MMHDEDIDIKLQEKEGQSLPDLDCLEHHWQEMRLVLQAPIANSVRKSRFDKGALRYLPVAFVVVMSTLFIARFAVKNNEPVNELDTLPVISKKDTVPDTSFRQSQHGNPMTDSSVLSSKDARKAAEPKMNNTKIGAKEINQAIEPGLQEADSYASKKDINYRAPIKANTGRNRVKTSPVKAGISISADSGKSLIPRLPSKTRKKRSN
jgi:hypothetical protein